MTEDRLQQCRSVHPAVRRLGRALEGPAGDVKAAPLVPQQGPPAADARRFPLGRAPEADRARAADEGDAPSRGCAPGQDQLGIVDYGEPWGERLLLDPLRDLGLVLGRIDAGQAQAGGGDPGRPPARAPRRARGRRHRSPHLGQGPFDRGGEGFESLLEPDVVEVAARAQAARQHLAIEVGEEGLGIGAPPVDGEQQVGGGHRAEARPRLEGGQSTLRAPGVPSRM